MWSVKRFLEKTKRKKRENLKNDVLQVDEIGTGRLFKVDEIGTGRLFKGKKVYR